MLLFNIIILISSKGMWKVIYKNISLWIKIWPVKMGVAMELYFIGILKERYLQWLMYNYWDCGHVVKFKMSNVYIPVSHFPYLMSQCKQKTCVSYYTSLVNVTWCMRLCHFLNGLRIRQRNKFSNMVSSMFSEQQSQGDW